MSKDDFSDSLEKALNVLRRGGTLLYPTDTIWGIGCDATDALAVDRVFRIKERPIEKSFIVLVSSEKDIIKYTADVHPEIFDFLKTAKKPTTVIYKNAIGIAPNACATDGSVAIRICQDDFCRQLIRRFGKPIVSTSANISGEKSPVNFAAISDEIKSGVDYVVSYRQSEEKAASPSSIITFTNNKIEFLRK